MGSERRKKGYTELKKVTKSYRELKFFDYLCISGTNSLFFGFLVLHLENSVIKLNK